MKGRSIKGIAFSELHSNWLVKIEKDADSSGALELIEQAKSVVLSKFGVELECEIRLWGFN